MRRRSLSVLDAPRYARIVAKPMLAGMNLGVSVTDRQEKMPGFDQALLRKTGVFCCGAGGLFAEQGPALARKGYVRLIIADADCFTPTNYPRQRCYRKDLFRNKAVCMARNSARESVLGGEFVGFGLPGEDALARVPPDRYAAGLCNVDNNPARTPFSVHFRKMGKPAIFCGVAEDAGSGWIFVQEAGPDAPCFGCAFPHKVNDIHQPCPGTPACVDILKVVGGFVLYALDSLFMPRPRFWNLRYVFLDGSIEDANVTVKKNPNCPLCGAGTGE